jgi:hypothetical protein
MIINNISAKEKALMEVIWEFESVEQIVSFVNTLPWRDKLAVAYLVEVAQLGGDEVDRVDLARAELDRIRAL